jgi:hypothetical protein
VEWYNVRFMEWFALIGQISVCYLSHKYIVLFFKNKKININKTKSVLLGWFVFILIFAPSIKW